MKDQLFLNQNYLKIQKTKHCTGDIYFQFTNSSISLQNGLIGNLNGCITYFQSCDDKF